MAIGQCSPRTAETRVHGGLGNAEPPTSEPACFDAFPSVPRPAADSLMSFLPCGPPPRERAATGASQGEPSRTGGRGNELFRSAVAIVTTRRWTTMSCCTRSAHGARQRADLRATADSRAIIVDRMSDVAGRLSPVRRWSGRLRAAQTRRNRLAPVTGLRRPAARHARTRRRRSAEDHASDVGLCGGADDGNRTRVFSLGS